MEGKILIPIRNHHWTLLSNRPGLPAKRGKPFDLCLVLDQHRSAGTGLPDRLYNAPIASTMAWIRSR